ncbi:uncharacterized protein LOC116033096 [Ipomoea triloba]|uniref:uncharacterized protein LOC116033096 n=1 Tax=Ipomoea triloba TaxID=35885 RepID=UPI00125D5642|nr:uncharacterized protein LOC116033096 [Ipomoea triloba]
MASSSKGKETLYEQYANLSISDDNEVEVNIATEDNEDLDTKSYMLVGSLMTEKMVCFNYLKETMAQTWRHRKGMMAEEVAPNLFIFYFCHKKDRQRILDDGPWSYDQNLLVLQKIESKDSPFDADFSKTEFWVQIHKIPQRFSNPKIAEIIGAHLGEFIKSDLEHFDGTRSALIRVRVILDITKPLKRRIKIKVSPEENICMECKYERLPTF